MITIVFRYANRAKNIKNKPKINEDPKDALLREFQDEILRLKQQLDKKGGDGSEGGNKKRKRRRRKGESELLFLNNNNKKKKNINNAPISITSDAHGAMNETRVSSEKKQ